jgi:hypothetical protein
MSDLCASPVASFPSMRDTRAEIIAELRRLYAKALAPMGSLVREAESFEPEAD